MSRNGRTTIPTELLLDHLGTAAPAPDLLPLVRTAAAELATGFVTGLVVVFGMLLTFALLVLLIRGAW